MKYKVGDRVESKVFGKGTIVETNSGSSKKSILVQFDNEDKRLHDGNGMSQKRHEAGRCYFYTGYFQDTLKLIKPMQFTKSDLKDGDIVTQRDGRKKILCNNAEVLKGVNDHSYLSLSDYKNDLTDKDGDTEYDIIKIERPTQYETIFERKEEILDEAEKRYLRSVIRPFRKTVRFIEKEDNGEISRIKICFDYHFMFFPMLEKEKKMYEGMKANQAYTLEQLGL